MSPPDFKLRELLQTAQDEKLVKQEEERLQDELLKAGAMAIAIAANLSFDYAGSIACGFALDMGLFQNSHVKCAWCKAIYPFGEVFFKEHILACKEHPMAKLIEELKWLRWFEENADFGPADGDVKDMMRAQYEAKKKDE